MAIPITGAVPKYAAKETYKERWNVCETCWVYNADESKFSGAVRSP